MTEQDTKSLTQASEQEELGVYFNVVSGKLARRKEGGRWIELGARDRERADFYTSIQSDALFAILHDCIQKSTLGEFLKSNDLITCDEVFFSSHEDTALCDSRPEAYRIREEIYVVRLLEEAKKVFALAVTQIHQVSDEFSDAELCQWAGALRSAEQCVYDKKDLVWSIYSRLEKWQLLDGFEAQHVTLHKFSTKEEFDSKQNKLLENQSLQSVAVVFRPTLSREMLVDCLSRSICKKHVTLDFYNIVEGCWFQDVLGLLAATFRVASTNVLETLPAESTIEVSRFSAESLTLYPPRERIYHWVDFFKSLAQCKTLKRLRIGIWHLPWEALFGGMFSWSFANTVQSHEKDILNNFFLVEISTSFTLPVNNGKSEIGNFESLCATVCERNKCLQWRNVKPYLVQVASLLFTTARAFGMYMPPYVILEIFDWLPPPPLPAHIAEKRQLPMPATNIIDERTKIRAIESVVASIKRAIAETRKEAL